jgi:hypothetical protein
VAAPATALTHIAIQERLDGKAVEWMERASDEQYAPGHRRSTVRGANAHSNTW